MWLKFVKGFSLQEKCNFSAIRISILFYIKRLFCFSPNLDPNLHKVHPYDVEKPY